MKNKKKIAQEELDVICAKIAAAHDIASQEEEVYYSQKQTIYENNKDSNQKRK
jgi:hypothetical protein